MRPPAAASRGGDADAGKRFVLIGSDGRVRKIEVWDATEKKRLHALDTPPRSGETVMRLIDIDKSYDGNRVYQSLNVELRRGERVALVVVRPLEDLVGFFG
jgi:ATPase subunit of ABC transporter with duplicated ATPase domains